MKRLLMATALSAAPFGAPAYAQNNTDAAADAAIDENLIIVTAQRREQSAQDVGVALSVFSGADLVSRGIDTVNGLENYVPNLEIESQFGGGIPSYSIRGVGFRDYASLNAPTVGLYVDDVAFPSPAMTQGLLFDIARVEVLRGPQGTLYGRNTTGGAIKFISNRPTSEVSAGGHFELARFGRVETEGYLSGPVNDRVRIRLSGVTAQGGAWQINRETGEELGDADNVAGRFQLEADLSDNVQLWLNVHGADNQSDGLGLQLFNDSTTLPGLAPRSPSLALAHQGRRETSFGSSQEFADLVGIAPGQAPFRDNQSYGVNASLSVDLGAFNVIYIGAYEALDRTEFNDFDGTEFGGAGVFFQSDIDVMSHELRAQGETGPLNWVGGVYYAREDLDELYQSDFVESFGPGFAVSTPYEQEVETIAVYLHGEYALSERLSFIGGVRYEDESRDLIGLGTFATGFGALNFANGTVDGTLEDRSLNSGNVSGKAALQFTPVENLLLYGSYSRGVKSGGFTAYNTLNPNALDPFRPEKLDAFEVGFKSDFGDGLMQLNGAAFYYDYTDQQVQSAIFDAGTGAIVGRIVNAPSSEIYGVELEAVINPAPWLTIGQSFGYKEGEFNEFTDLDTAATGAASSAVFIDRAGQSLGFPELSYQGYAAGAFDVAPGYIMEARFDYAYRDTLSLPLLGPVFAVDDYWLANAEVTVRPDGGPWGVSVWGRNIFNTDYDETRNFFIAPGGVADVAAPGQVATYGVRVSFDY